MALFIRIEVDTQTSRDPSSVAKLTEACPVNIFSKGTNGGLEIIDENVDECTLCELCLQAAPPGSVRVVKLYDEADALVRAS